MIILAIETSCDDTGISLVKATGGFKRPQFKVLSHNLSSQTQIHEKWGGVVPALAKREHGRNLVPLLTKTLKEGGLRQVTTPQNSPADTKKIRKILEREPELLELFNKVIPTLKTPKLDAIAVTKGPGLEPALWVGINFARALSLVWRKPLIPVNHLEGHLCAGLVKEKDKDKRAKPKNPPLNFPALALIVSGGHTELVLTHGWLKYKQIGGTRDDAIGEAFDKVARILELPYPGGPQISKLAKETKDRKENPISLPRPMINSPDFDFSFSGLKTAVLYLVQKLKAENKLDKETKSFIAADFQQACLDVLLAKTQKALIKFKPRTIIVGGGVIANRELRQQLTRMIAQNFPTVSLIIPELGYTTDNATMIAAAGYLQSLSKKKLRVAPRLRAQGQMPLK
ncbi:MAG TPA: tRNA (adenosine(37)-N6)-threonylcarbamoyltransferase complex transferase subunit TsaD [Candidatus Paceibacterota bacterium]|jgi:N6-L-threonylcarbamoyladenine synthase|nr:tRNA (adenosine(37)-N6)-threonylcarbamoyltransferase complex transferase subunit TsaD [Candidatus Paceibacterota bacterium]HOH11498.1 tRNA (adenosine(37)-N6)-threonylcarbamoyltransferase complex transferase subunit TsaD [Candidatus Paceibacterota bacterium]HOY11178.1 tRNA (adenosine(37)-N6)-threonylcarbamoyltransferase complex transferase subunit TsaD [Candidatus Paceibacterota bacterium]HPI24646.1 tRNA (adenosine(37)-N6)-threonylcarbamoyltransferase complex transferase subunit TsaD [Candidat